MSKMIPSAVIISNHNKQVCKDNKLPCYVKMRYCRERAECVNANVPTRNQFGPPEFAARKEVWQLVVAAQDLFVMLSSLHTYFI